MDKHWAVILALAPATRDPHCSVVDLRTHLKKARRARWAGKTKNEKKAAASKASRAFWDSLTPRQRSKVASTASRAYWDSMTPKQRSAEMKRRAAKRKRARRRVAKT